MSMAEISDLICTVAMYSRVHHPVGSLSRETICILYILQALINSNHAEMRSSLLTTGEAHFHRHRYERNVILARVQGRQKYLFRETMRVREYIEDESDGVSTRKKRRVSVAAAEFFKCPKHSRECALAHSQVRAAARQSNISRWESTGVLAGVALPLSTAYQGIMSVTSVRLPDSFHIIRPHSPFALARCFSPD